MRDHDYRDLTNLAREMDVSMSWLGRRAFSDLLKKYRNGEGVQILKSGKNGDKRTLERDQ